MEKLDRIFEQMNNIHYPPANTYKDVHSHKAFLKKDENELESIYHLTESHSPFFRYNASVLYEKCVNDKSMKVFPLIKDNFKFSCSNTEIQIQIQNMLERIEEMPKEWTLVQLTPYTKFEQRIQLNSSKFLISTLNVTVFNCGQNKFKPFTVSVDVPKDNNRATIEIIEKIRNITIVEQKKYANFQRVKTNQEMQEYKEFRSSLNESLEECVKIVQDRWLGAFRILFMGKYNETIEKEIDEKLEFILENNNLSNIPEKSKIILKYLAKGLSYLHLGEIKDILKYCLGDIDTKIRTNFVKSLRNTFSSKLESKLHPVILIVEESLDVIPWEMIDIMQEQPSSRMDSLHFAYALYKEHEVDIVDGWKIIEYPVKGTHILNPDLDLMKMHIRLNSFFNYWTPDWNGVVGRIPLDSEILDMVTTNNIFCYNGHGNGFQFIPTNQIKRLRMNCVVLLFGCSSTEMKPLGPQCGYHAPFMSYITACSPCIVGMLWTITDTDTDLLSTDFISRWVPSKAETHWLNLDRTAWIKGKEEIDMKTTRTVNSITYKHEPELLSALLIAKKSARQYLTRAACIVRGLPVKIGY